MIWDCNLSGELDRDGVRPGRADPVVRAGLRGALQPCCASAADWLLGRRAGRGISVSHVASYTVAQITGGIVGAVLANVMFDRRVLQIATKDRVTDRSFSSVRSSPRRG